MDRDPCSVAVLILDAEHRGNQTHHAILVLVAHAIRQHNFPHGDNDRAAIYVGHSRFNRAGKADGIRGLSLQCLALRTQGRRISQPF